MTIKTAIASTIEGVMDYTDDIGISKRFIYNELLLNRSELTKQELNKKRLFDASFAQTIEGFTLSRSDISGQLNYNHTPVLISDVLIPKVIENETGPTIWVFNMLGEPIILTDKTSWLKRKKRRFQNNDPIAFIDKDRLVVDGFQDLEELRIDLTAYYYDPIVVAKYNSMYSKDDCESSNCKPVYEYEFSCTEHIGRRCIEMARAVILRKLGIPEDIENNSILDKNKQNVSNKA